MARGHSKYFFQSTSYFPDFSWICLKFLFFIFLNFDLPEIFNRNLEKSLDKNVTIFFSVHFDRKIAFKGVSLFKN